MTSPHSRQLLGEGIRMSVKENGDVWLECRGKHPVFVHCHYLDRESGRGSGDAIHKIYSGSALKVSLGSCIHKYYNFNHLII